VKINKTLFTLLLGTSAIANAGVMNVSNDIFNKISTNQQWQKAALATVTPDVYGKCLVFQLMILGSEVNGSPLSEDGTNLVGVLGGALLYYRKYQLAKGVPESTIDQMFAPYHQEGKRLGLQGYVDKYSNYCTTKAIEFANAATKK